MVPGTRSLDHARGGGVGRLLNGPVAKEFAYWNVACILPCQAATAEGEVPEDRLLADEVTRDGAPT